MSGIASGDWAGYRNTAFNVVNDRGDVWGDVACRLAGVRPRSGGPVPTPGCFVCFLRRLDFHTRVNSLRRGIVMTFSCDLSEPSTRACIELQHPPSGADGGDE
jgi:hypothetical protein